MGLIRIAAAGAIGYALYRYASRDGEARTGQDDRHFTRVRDAGPEHMKSAPQNWSRTDEAIDESFPASDPAAVY